jgi:hypothetical protein
LFYLLLPIDRVHLTLWYKLFHIYRGGSHPLSTPYFANFALPRTVIPVCRWLKGDSGLNIYILFATHSYLVLNGSMAKSIRPNAGSRSPQSVVIQCTGNDWKGPMIISDRPSSSVAPQSPPHETTYLNRRSTTLPNLPQHPKTGPAPRSDNQPWPMAEEIL